MRGVGEEVERLDGNQSVIIEQHPGLGKEGSGVAGRVDDPFGIDLNDPLDDLLADAGAGGIEYRQMESLVPVMAMLQEHTRRLPRQEF